MKCFYRGFTIFGDKEGEMFTYDTYKGITVVGKKTYLIPFQDIFFSKNEETPLLRYFRAFFPQKP